MLIPQMLSQLKRQSDSTSGAQHTGVNGFDILGQQLDSTSFGKYSSLLNLFRNKTQSLSEPSSRLDTDGGGYLQTTSEIKSVYAEQ